MLALLGIAGCNAKPTSMNAHLNRARTAERALTVLLRSAVSVLPDTAVFCVKPILTNAFPLPAQTVGRVVIWSIHTIAPAWWDIAVHIVKLHSTRACCVRWHTHPSQPVMHWPLSTHLPMRLLRPSSIQAHCRALGGLCTTERIFTPPMLHLCH